jgi:hypothetical protein
MKSKLLKTGLLVLITVCGTSIPSYSDTCDDLKFLGYSENITQEISQALEETGVVEPDIKVLSDNDTQALTEVEAVQEQLYELGVTRGLSAQSIDQSDRLQRELTTFWEDVETTKTPEKVSAEIKQQIYNNILSDLNKAGYDVLRLEILDLPEGNTDQQIRAIVRAVKPLKTKNSYLEIQKNLIQIKAICVKAATIGSMPYLSELTSFVAENPKNKYYYEKTILNY